MKASGDRQELQFAPLEPKFVPSFSDSEEVDDAAEEDGKKRESQSQADTARAAKRVKGEKPTSMQDQSSEVKGEQDEVEEVEPTFEEALEAEVEHFLQKGDEEAALSGSPSFVSDNEEVKEMKPTMKVVLLRGKGLVSLENVVQYALYKAGLYKYYVDRCVSKTLEALDFEELTALIEQAKKHSQLMSFMKQTHQREDVPDDWVHCFGSAQETAGDELRFFVVWLAYDSLEAMDVKNSTGAEAALEKAGAASGPEVSEAATVESKGPILPKESIEKSEVAKDGKNSTGAEAALEKAGAPSGPSGPEVSEAATVETVESKGPILPKESIEKSEVAMDGKNSTGAEAALEKAGAASGPSGPEVSEAATVETVESKGPILPKESIEKSEVAMDGKNSTGAEAALEKAGAASGPSGPEVSEAATVETVESKGPILPKESIEKSEVAMDGKNSTDAEAALEKAGAASGPSGPEVSEAATVETVESKGPILPKESIEKSEVAMDGKNSTDAEAALEKAAAPSGPSGPEVSEAATVEGPIEPKEFTVLAQPDAPKETCAGASKVEVQADASPSAAASLEKETSKCSEVQGDVAPKEPVNPKKMEKEEAGEKTEGAGAGRAHLENKDKGNDKDAHAIGLCNGQWSQCQ